MRSTLRLAAVAGLLGAAACSDGGTGPDLSALRRDEAVQLAARIGAASSDALGASAASRAAASAAAADPFGLTRGIDLTAPCPLGGRVDVDGTFALSVDAATRSGSLVADATMVHRGCGLKLEEGSLILDGQPELAVSSRFAWADGQPTEPLRVTHSGAVAWTRDGGETGTCAVDLVAVTDLVARRRTVQGTFCGFAIDEETAWTGG